MNEQKIIFTALLLCIINILCANGAVAQGSEYRGEIFGNIGVVKIFDDETNLGNGVGYGGGIGYRFTRRLGVDFEVNSLNHRRDAGVWVIDGYALTAGGGLQVHFLPESTAQPFVRAAIVWARYHGTSRSNPTFEPGLPPQSITSNQTFYGPEIGGGIRFFAGKRWSIRPEFRMTLLNGTKDYLPGRDIIEPGLWAPRFNVAVAYHW